MRVAAIRYSVAVAVPTPTVKLPAAIALDPFMRPVTVTMTRFHVMPFHPDVAVTLPVPVAGRPHIAVAGRRHMLNPRRGRRGINVNIDRRHRRQRQRRATEQAGSYECRYQ